MVRKRRLRSDAANNSVFLPMELIIEILSLLSVKDIVRFKCVSKSWNNLTSDSNFVDKHLKASSRNPHLTLSWHENNAELTKNVVPVSVHRLLKKQSATVSSDDFHRMENPSRFVGSCNGLFCFLSWIPLAQPFKYFFHITNPATRTRSEQIEFTFGEDFHFTFGYDASNTTYKVVAFRAKEISNEVKVFNLGGNNCWRNIQNFPVVPYIRFDHYYIIPSLNNGAHLYGTINWLALDKSITPIHQFVIVSLDLSTEKYKQFLLPLGFDHAPFSQPVLRVLMDCLCFFHGFNLTEFILWKMKEYGVQDSWTRLFKISYQNLAMQLPIRLRVKTYCLHYPLACLYVNGDTVIFACECCKKSLIYNLKDKTVVKIKSRNTIYWFIDSKDYVESLVSVH
ncbi:F-box/kelch-repeat protein At3g23880-like [Trifolium pratense]|uniref:F-box/kelch-repeat protein At3g23880-like n=1 Tax=Trifolium pratense TaxID=57577 RepID=UPI001E693AED|nr:F-box/kelch-repeat protein At3g23880-like [Trifolium pratense]